MTTDLENDPPPPAAALLAGLVGALAMTSVHEAERRVWPAAPRFDALGRRALNRLVAATGHRPPGRDAGQALALGGDVLSNSALFALAVAAGPARSAPARGLAVGAVAGCLTLALPPRLGIGPPPTALPTATRVATVALYAGGGLVAGLVARRRVGLRSGSTPS